MHDDPGLVRIGAGLLFASLWQSLALTACTGMMLQFASKISARNRFRLWSLTFFLCNLLPLIELEPRILAPATSSTLQALAARSTGMISLSLTFARGCLAIWGIATFISLLRLMSGLWAVRRLIATARQAPAVLSNLGHRVKGWEKCGAMLLLSDRVSSPIAVGFMKPVIVLPGYILKSLTEEKILALLQHEVQHIARGDNWTTLAIRAFRTLFPLNPSLWYIDRQLAAVRELACDDGVLAAGISAQEYAGCLMTITELAFHRRSRQLVSGLIGRRNQMFFRIDRILSPAKCEMPGHTFSIYMSASLAVIAGLLLSTPDLLSFPAPAALQPSASAHASPKTSNEGPDYLASPSLYPYAPSVRPPSMPVLPLPRTLRRLADAAYPNKSVEA